MDSITLNWNGWQFININNFVSNLILGLVCIICSYFLARLLGDQLVKHWFWRLFFLSLGISGLLGGLGHTLEHYPIEANLLLSSWALNLIAILMLERAVIEQIRSEELRKWLIVTVYTKLLVMLILLFIKEDYLIVTISSAVGMLGFLLPVVSFHIRKKTEVSVTWFVVGFILSVLGGLVFALKWDINLWLQHADIGHYFIAGSIICFYKGVAWLSYEAKLYPTRDEVWF